MVLFLWITSTNLKVFLKVVLSHRTKAFPSDHPVLSLLCSVYSLMWLLWLGEGWSDAGSSSLILCVLGYQEAGQEAQGCDREHPSGDDTHGELHGPQLCWPEHSARGGACVRHLHGLAQLQQPLWVHTYTPSRCSISCGWSEEFTLLYERKAFILRHQSDANLHEESGATVDVFIGR